MIDGRRSELLKLAEDDQDGADLWHLIEVLVRPLAEQATEPGSHYVRFLNRVFEHAGHDVTVLSKIGGVDQAVAVGRLMGEQLPHMAQPQAQPRIRWAGQLIITGLADLEGRCGLPGDPDEPLDHETFTLGLIDAVTGLMQAPVSPARAPAPHQKEQSQ